MLIDHLQLIIVFDQSNIFATIITKQSFQTRQFQYMKNFISKILDEPTEEAIFKFVPQIKISPKSTLHLQIQPNDPHTASNILINAYLSKTQRTIVPIRIEWSRYKFKSDEQYTVEKIPSVVGNTYMCEPSDLGSVIQAKVKCLDSSVGGQAQATIGPIRIDAMLKRLIDGALYNESLLSQMIVVEGEDKLNVNLRLGKNIMQFTQIDTSQKLVMPYTLSQPKIQLSPKDPCKVYLRFQQDTNNTVRSWLNKLTFVQKNSRANINQSSLSMKIPHSNVSAVSSKTKLFQKSNTHCINKIQVRFLSRNSRDLFLFTLRAFVCKEDMKNSLVMQRIQTLQSLKSQEDYTKFLDYISLKSQIIRLAQICKQLQLDRDNKVKDINLMEESISEMTLTYLKIIEEKSQNQHVDLEQSYSMISMKRQQILGRKNFRQLKNQNQKLKTHIRDLNEQIQLQKFFKKDDNQSMIFNQTANPFLKKNSSAMVDQNQSGSYYIGSPEVRVNDPTHKNMVEISKSYMKVLEQNAKLKLMSNSGGKNDPDRSRNIQNLLQSLHEDEQVDNKFAKMHQTIENLKDQISKLKQMNSNLNKENSNLKNKIASNSTGQNNYSLNNNAVNGHPLNTPLNNSSFKQHQLSYVSRSSAQNNSILSNSYISINQSMTSQAELNLLENKLIQLANLNTKFESQNNRLRRERNYFRVLAQTQNKNQFIQPSRDRQIITPAKPNLQDSNLLGDNNDNSIILRLREQKQKLENQKNSLLKKIDSLTRQSNTLKSDTNLQKKYQQLSRNNEKLMRENQNLEKTIQNMKSYHDLQKKQLNNSQSGNSNSNSIQNSSPYQQSVINNKDEEIQKLKKVNTNLLGQIKQFKIQNQKRNDSNLGSSRVIELQSQLDIFKTYAQGGNISHSSQQKNFSNIQSEQLLLQLVQLKKQNQRLKQQILNLQLKIKTQTSTIQKLMSELDQLNHSQMRESSALQNSFSMKYLTPTGKSSHQQEQREKYRKKVVQLQGELQILRRNSDAFNRSRDLSMSMMGFQQQKLELYKKQIQGLMFQNQNLSKMCSKYAKDAREANLQLNKLRQKIMIMNKQRYSEQI